MNAETLLYRQVHPTAIIPHGSRLASSVFLPENKGDDSISVYNGDMISPDDAVRHYRDDLKNKTLGVIGLSLSKFQEQGLTALHDADPFPAHVSLSYPASMSHSQRIKKARILARRARWYGSSP